MPKQPNKLLSRSEIEKLKNGDEKLLILLIGVNQYQDLNLEKLSFCANDCDGLAKAFKIATSQFSQTEIIIHHDNAPQKPLFDKVNQSINYLIEKADENTHIIIYFSGHGSILKQNNKLVLCLQNSNIETGENCLYVEQIFIKLTNSQAKKQTLLLDACHSGKTSLINDLQSKDQTSLSSHTLKNKLSSALINIVKTKAKNSKGFCAILSCDENEKSYPFFETLDHSLFTYYLIQGIQGEASDEQNIIEITYLYRYIYLNVTSYLNKRNQKIEFDTKNTSQLDININDTNEGIEDDKKQVKTEQKKDKPITQTPKLIFEGTGEFILGIKNSENNEINLRKALVIDGLNPSNHTIKLLKILKSKGRFTIDYVASISDKKNNSSSQENQEFSLQNNQESSVKKWLSIEEKITDCLSTGIISLLYLRGKLEETPTGESQIVLGNQMRISRSWLRKQLRNNPPQLNNQYKSQQIIIIDSPKSDYIKDWMEDLQLNQEESKSQFIITAYSNDKNNEQFIQTLIKIISETEINKGLTAVSLIYELQQNLPKTTFYPSLSSGEGIIEFLLPQEFYEIINEDIDYCPYMGLESFSKNDALFFFGREKLANDITKLLKTKSFLAVVGASGSGKSSVVKAGVLFNLENQGLECLENSKSIIKKCWTNSFRPSNNPLQQLAFALTPLCENEREKYELEGMLHIGAEGLIYKINEFLDWLRQRNQRMIVLVIDQFEELFNEEQISNYERKEFINLILTAVEEITDKFKILITLRSDFISSCLDIPKLAELVKENNILVPSALNEQEYREIIVQPANKVGLSVESELVDVLIKEVQKASVGLPLLEYVLEYLWKHRQEGRLTLQSYLYEIGGLQEVLEKKANEVYEQFNQEEKECAKWIFLELVNLGEGKENTRRRILKSDLTTAKYSQELIDKTLSKLITARLIITTSEKDSKNQEVLLAVIILLAEEKLDKFLFFLLKMILNQGKEITKNQVQSKGEKVFDKSIIPLNHSSQGELFNADIEAEMKELKSEVSVEIAHEILIGSWSQLQWWLTINREKIRLKREIEHNAKQWDNHNRDSSFLSSGTAFNLAKKLYDEYTDELSSLIHEFIDACIESEKKNEAEKEARKLEKLEAKAALKENQILNEANQKAKQKIRQGSFILITSLIFAAIASGLATFAVRGFRVAQKGTQLEQASVNILQQFRGGEIEALLSAMENGQTLKTLMKENNSISEYPAISPIFALQQILDNIHEQNRFNGEQDEIKSVSFNPNGELATAGKDGTVILWDISGKQKLKLVGHEGGVLGGVNEVKFSSNGQLIATGGEDGTVRLWNLSGKEIKKIQAHQDGVNSVVFSPDNQLIATVGEDAIAKMWTLSGEKKLELKGHQNKINGISISANGKVIATAGEDGTVRLWNLSGEEIKKIQAHQGKKVFSVNFSSDGKYIATAGADNFAKIWDISGKLVVELGGHQGWVTNVNFSPDSKYVATASDDGTARLWNLSGKEISKFQGHRGVVWSAIFSADGKYLATAGRDEITRLWNLYDKQSVKFVGHQNDVNSVDFSPNGDLIAAADHDGIVKIWDISGEKKAQWQAEKRGPLWSVVFSPNGQFIATGGYDRISRIWDLSGNLKTSLQGHQGWLSSISFSPNGQFIATSGSDKTARIWNLSGEEIAILEGNNDVVYQVDFNNDNNLIATGTWDGVITLWDISGKQIKQWKAHQGQIRSLSFTPDGKYVVTGDNNSIISLWDLSGKQQLEFFTYQNGINSLTVSNNGQMIATGGMDGSIKIWDLQARQIAEFKQPQGAVWGLSFSDDDKFIVSGGDNGLAQLWEIKTLDELLINSCEWLKDYIHKNPQVINRVKLCKN